MKHTPAPWIHVAGNLVRDAHGNCITGDSSQMRGDIGQANARLIAAAPELLDACKAFVRDRATCPTANGKDLEAWDMMCAAIAKAERGEAQS